VVKNQATKKDGFFKDISGTKLSSVETVIGSNASGKTNLLRLLPFMRWIVVDSFNADPNLPILLQPFKFDGTPDKPSELSTEFEVEGVIYNYHFSLAQERILEERLSFKSKTNIKNTYKTAFSRKWNSENDKYTLIDKTFKFPKGFENVIRKNSSLIASAIRLNHKLSQDIANFWKSIETNVVEAGWIGDSMLANSSINFLETLKFFSENDVLKKEAEKVLSTYDLGLDSLDIKQEKKDDGSISITAKVGHNFNGSKQYLDMRYESSGTKQLLVLLKTVLSVLNNGGVAVLDEIDVNLHSEIVLSLLKLFLQPETNNKNAQLIFSTHSHLVLSSLNKYQIVFVEKNNKGISESWRLDDMAGIRPDENYYLKYITGVYGAFPHIS
jgi:AAA15 family ATPase/GTPase